MNKRLLTLVSVLLSFALLTAACNGHEDSAHDQVASRPDPAGQSDPWTIRSNHGRLANGNAYADFINNSAAGDNPYVKMCMLFAETATANTSSEVLRAGGRCTTKTLTDNHRIEQAPVEGGYMHVVESHWRWGSDPLGDDGLWCEYHDPDGSNWPTGSGWSCVARDLDGNN